MNALTVACAGASDGPMSGSRLAVSAPSAGSATWRKTPYSFTRRKARGMTTGGGAEPRVTARSCSMTSKPLA
jgi:hypothetical protein